ncbi:MAG: hypothetical protein EBZ13_14020 [Planctomycetia bacterium]|nr:hypothetical protein [Planctomycetia bacterium]
MFLEDILRFERRGFILVSRTAEAANATEEFAMPNLSFVGPLGRLFRRPQAAGNGLRSARRNRSSPASLGIENLEQRAVLAADNLLAPSDEFEQLQPFKQPPVISSQNGILEADVRLVSAGTDSNPILYGTEELYTGTATDDATDQLIAAMAYQFDAYGTSYPASFPGPTLQFNPGDTLKLSITNDLSTNLDANEIATNFHFPASPHEHARAGLWRPRRHDSDW